PVDRAMSLIGRSRVAALKLDAAAAVEHARAAMDLLGSTHAGEQGAAVWAFARALAPHGGADRSIDVYHRAVDLLSAHGQPHAAGRAAIELAKLLQKEGRGEEAEPILRRAYDLGVDAETASARQR